MAGPVQGHFLVRSGAWPRSLACCATFLESDYLVIIADVISTQEGTAGHIFPFTNNRELFTTSFC